MSHSLFSNTSSTDIFDLLIKVVIVGNSSVGKSQLLMRYTKNDFKHGHAPTIGVEFGTKSLTIDNTSIRAQFWDTAGQERFKAITSSYYRNATGALLVFDMTSKESF